MVSYSLRWVHRRSPFSPRDLILVTCAPSTVPQNRITVITFGNVPTVLQPSGQVIGRALPSLKPQIAGLFTGGNGTALYRSVALGMGLLSTQRSVDIVAGETYNYIMVVQVGRRKRVTCKHQTCLKSTRMPLFLRRAPDG